MRLRNDIHTLRTLVGRPEAAPTDHELAALEEQDSAVVLWLNEDLGNSSGYNPYRDDVGRFATADKATNTGARKSWRAGFDSIDHDRHIDDLKRSEGKHRAASLKIKDKLVSLAAKAKTATPKRQAALKAKFDALSAEREAHQQAANAAKANRAAAKRDLDAARSGHHSQRKAAAAANKMLQAQRKQAERESIGRIGGGFRIGGSDAETAATDAAPETKYSDTPDFHFGIGVHAIRAEPEPTPKFIKTNKSSVGLGYDPPPSKPPPSPEDEEKERERRQQKDIEMWKEIRNKLKQRDRENSTLSKAASMVSLPMPKPGPGISKRRIQDIFSPNSW